MKLIVRQYLASLRERGELDVMLPDLLSELSFDVLSRPGRGTRQAGVDVAAVGPDPDGEGKRTLFLFTIKAGDLDRQDWDGTPQAVRPSLNEILDDYILHRVPEQYAGLDIAVCVCMGGEMKETVRAQWTGFVAKHQTERLRFREWNGDRLANLLLAGVLRQEVLGHEHRMSFQKAVAMLDEPDIAYRHFESLLRSLLGEVDDRKESTTRLRQAHICLWILFVWAREAGNLESPYRASELALLHAWDVCRRSETAREIIQKSRMEVLDHILQLHFSIARMLLAEKIGPFTDKTFALSFAANSQSSIDVNLTLFEIFGRLSLLGLWQHWIATSQDDENVEALADRDHCFVLALQTINNNPILCAPLRDDHQIEIALFMLLASVCGPLDRVKNYLVEIAERLIFRIRTRRDWPTHLTAYRELARHPVDRSDDYFQRTTRGSVLYPLLMTWLGKLGEEDVHERLGKLLREKLAHTTHQLWVPDEATDDRVWRGLEMHGVAIPVPRLGGDEGAVSFADDVDRAIRDHPTFNEVSALRSGFWPLLLLACRHHRLPVPPHLWFPEEPEEAVE